MSDVSKIPIRINYLVIGGCAVEIWTGGKWRLLTDNLTEVNIDKAEAAIKAILAIGPDYERWPDEKWVLTGEAYEDPDQ